MRAASVRHYNVSLFRVPSTRNALVVLTIARNLNTIMVATIFPRLCRPTVAIEVSWDFRIDRGRSYGYQWYMGDLAAPTASQPFHWVGGIGWGGQRLFVFPALDLVVGMNCGNYRKPGLEQGRVNGVVLTEVVLPSFV